MGRGATRRRQRQQQQPVNHNEQAGVRGGGGSLWGMARERGGEEGKMNQQAGRKLPHDRKTTIPPPTRLSPSLNARCWKWRRSSLIDTRRGDRYHEVRSLLSLFFVLSLSLSLHRFCGDGKGSDYLSRSSDSKRVSLYQLHSSRSLRSPRA